MKLHLRTQLKALLTSARVVQLVAVLAVVNVIGYLTMGKTHLVAYFILFACMVRYFSKNMIIVLGCPLLIVNLLALHESSVFSQREGLQNSTDASNNVMIQKLASAQTKASNTSSNTTKNRPDKKTSQGLSMNPIVQDASSNGTNENRTNENRTKNEEGEKQGFEPGRRKNRSYDIDYATTIEDAYDQLNDILGSDGIQRLTTDTQHLMKQQMQLAEAMKGMGPMIEQIAPMVNNLKGMMGGKEGLGGVLDFAKQLTGKK